MASELPRGRASCRELRTTIQRFNTFASLDFHKHGRPRNLRVGEMAKRLALGFDPKPACWVVETRMGGAFTIHAMARRPDYGWTQPILTLILILAVAQFSPRLPIGEGDMFKQLIKRCLPAPALRLVRFYTNREFNNLSTEQIFTRIYECGAWGRSEDPTLTFYSGSGSHRDEENALYVRAVGEFLGSFPVKPSVVDLGCGDFKVGSQIRNLCGRYVACDVVPSLIAFNKTRFQNMDVEFK